MIELSHKKAAAFEYIPGESLIHRLNPLLKIIMLLVASLIVFRFESLFALLTIILLLFWQFKLAGIPIRCVRLDLTPVIFQLLFTIPLAMLSEGFGAHAAILITQVTLRFSIMVSSASLLIRTTSPWKLFEALRFVLGKRIALLSLTAIRYVPIMSGELKEISRIQELRTQGGFHGGIRGFLKRGAALFIPYTQISVRKAEEIAVALHARGIVQNE